jgi:hypothetical protein
MSINISTTIRHQHDVDTRSGYEEDGTLTATTSQTSLSAGRHHHHHHHHHQQQQQQHQHQSRPLPSTPIVVKEEEEEEASQSQLMLKEKEQERIRKYINRMFKDSKLPNLIDTFPRYDSKKLMKGTLLGKGSFCSVYKLQRGSVILADSPDYDDRHHQQKEQKQSTMTTATTLKRPEEKQHPKIIATTTTKSLLPSWRALLLLLSRRHQQRCSEGRIKRKMTRIDFTTKNKYAVKIVSKDIGDIGSTELLVRSVAFLAAETRILSSLDHPHIIRLCGVCSSSSYRQ